MNPPILQNEETLEQLLQKQQLVENVEQMSPIYLEGIKRILTVSADTELISFEEALDLGLINYIYEPENYWDEVMQYAKSFCPHNKASNAVGRIKRAVQSGAEVSFSESMAVERELQ